MPTEWDDGYGPPSEADSAWYQHHVVSKGYPRVKRDKPMSGQMAITDPVVPGPETPADPDHYSMRRKERVAHDDVETPHQFCFCGSWMLLEGATPGTFEPQTDDYNRHGRDWCGEKTAHGSAGRTDVASEALDLLDRIVMNNVGVVGILGMNYTQFCGVREDLRSSHSQEADDA